MATFKERAMMAREKYGIKPTGVSDLPITEGMSFKERAAAAREKYGVKEELHGTMGTRGVPTFDDIYKYIVQETRKGNWSGAQNTERKYWERMTDAERKKLNDLYAGYGMISASGGSALTAANVGKLKTPSQKQEEKEQERYQRQVQASVDKLNPLKYVKGVLQTDGEPEKLMLSSMIGNAYGNGGVVRNLVKGVAENMWQGSRELKAMAKAEKDAANPEKAYGGKDGHTLATAAKKAAADYEDSYHALQISTMELQELTGTLEGLGKRLEAAENAYKKNPTEKNHQAYLAAWNAYDAKAKVYDGLRNVYETAYVDYAAKADAAGKARTAYDDHIASWEKGLETAEQEREIARRDVEAYGRMGADTANHTFTYASQEEAKKALEAADEKVRWKQSLDAENAYKGREQQKVLMRQDPEYGKFAAQGKSIQAAYDTAAKEADYYVRGGASAGYQFSYESQEEAMRVLSFIRKKYGDLSAMPVTERNTKMTAAELNDYYYLLGKGDGAGAMEYYKGIREDLTARLGKEKAEEIEKLPTVQRIAKKAWTGFNEGAQRALLGAVQHFKEEAIPTTTLAATTQASLQMSGEGEKFLLQTAQQVGNMLPQMYLAYTGVGMPAVIGVTASGNATNQALKEGYGQAEARTYGVLVGAAEAALEKLLGVAGKNVGIAPEAILRRVGQVDNMLLRFGLHLGVDLGGEIAEEELQNFLEPAIANIVLGKKYEAPTAEMLIETALITAVSTLLLSSGDSLSRAKYDGNVNRLVKMGLSSDNDSTGYRMAQDIQQRRQNGEEILPDEVKALYQVVMGESSAETKKAASEVETTEQYAIGYTTDNKPFVAVEEDILDGVPEENWVKTVKENLKKKFPNGITVSKTRMKVNSQTTSEMTYSEYSKWLKDNSPEEYADKFRATNNADEILYATQNWVNEGLNHPRTDNIIEFARGDVLIKVGKNDYMADVVVATTKGGSQVLYDIVNMVPTEIIEKSQGQTAATSNEGISHRTPDLDSINSISNTPQNNNPQNVEGVTNDGTEGNGVSDAGGQRYDGTGAGEQVRGLDRGTEPAKPRGNLSEQIARAGKRRGFAKDLQKVSSKALGVNAGTERETVSVLQEDMYDEELREVSNQLEKETGKKPVFVLGGLQVQTKRGVKTAKGAILPDGTIIIQADHARYSATQIAKHELFHHKSSLNLLSVPTAIRKIRERFTEAEFGKVVERYMQAYAGIIDIPENADAQTVEDALNKLYEEILADAHAEINAFDAEKFSEVVGEYMAEQESTGTEQTAAATERTTGPPDAMAMDERFAVDINEVPQEIHDFVDNAVQDRKSNDEFVVTTATKVDNSAINRLGSSWQGKYTDRPRSFSGEYVRHILNEHGNALLEMLRGQMYMSRDSIKIALSQLQEGKGRIIRGTFTERGLPSVLTEIPVNGYTLYAEEPLELQAGTELEGRTMYMTPTSTTALKWNYSTSIPQRRGGASYSSISGKDRIVNKVLSGKDGKPTALYFAEENGTPFAARETYGAVLMCTDKKAAKTVSKKKLATRSGYAMVSNPCVATQDNPVINKEDIRNGEVAQRIAEIKAKGFDAIIMDYKDGDNYAVVVFDKGKVISESEYEAMQEKPADDRFSVDVDEEVETTNTAPVGEAAKLQQEIARQQDPAYIQQQYTEGGFAAVKKAEDTVKKLQARLDKLQGIEKPKRAKKEVKPAEESKPTIAKNDLKKTVLDIFSVPQWRKKELGSLIDGYAEQVLRNGRLTEADRKAFFDKLYASGLVTAEADEYLQTGREAVVGRKIYASDSVKAEFGEDWNAFRKRAFAAGVYLVNDSGRLGVDVAHMELAEMLPGLFDAEEYDQRIMLERIVEVAEEGKEEMLSLSKYAARLAGQHIITEDEFLFELETKLDAALKSFAEKAEMEILLRDRTGIQLAKEREQRRELMKQQQEAKLLKEEQQRTLKNLQWLKKNWRKIKPEDLEAGVLPPELQKTWDEVLSDIDLYCTSFANATRYSEKYDATWREISDIYEAARASDPNFIPDKNMEKIMDRVKKDKLSELDPETLQNVLNAVLAVRHAYQERNNVLGEMEHELFSEALRDTRTVFGKLKRATADKLAKKKGFFEKQLSDENKMLKLCGGDTNSTFWKMTQQLVKGERKMNWYRAEAYGRIQKFMDTHKKWLDGADGQGKNGRWIEVEVPECLSLEVGKVPEFGKTHKIFMTELQRVHLYLESKGEDNLRHMLGGRTFCNRSLYQQGLTKDAWTRDTVYTGGDNSNANRAVTVRLAPETVKAMVKDMTAEERELAKLLEDYYNTFAKKEINQVSQVLYGFDKAMGRYYAPIRTNSIFTKSEPGVYDETAAGVGHMKDRQTGSKNPSLNLSALDSFMRHVDDTSRFVGMAIPARNWNSFTNWQSYADGERISVQGEIEKAWGKDAANQIADILTELQSGGKDPATGMAGFTDWAYRQHVKAIFAGNLSSVLKQFGSYFMGSGVLDFETMPKTVVKGYDRKLIDRYTHTMKMRESGDYSKEVRMAVNADDWTQSNAVTKFIFGGAMTKTDTVTAGLLWSWAENQMKKDYPDLEKGTQEQIDAGESPFYQKVAEVFDDAVELSQSGDTAMRSSELRKSDSAIDRTLTMFKPDAAKGYNMLARNILIRQHLKDSGASQTEIKAVNAKIGQTVTGIALNNVWAAAITLAVAALKGKTRDYEDEDGEVTARGVMLGVLEDIGQGVIGTVAGAEEIAEVIGNLIAGEKWYGIDTPGLSQIEELIDGAGGGVKGIAEVLVGAAKITADGGDIGEYWRRNWQTMLGSMTSVGKVFAKYGAGLPVDNAVSYLFRPLKHFLPGMTTEMEDWFTKPAKANLDGLKGKALETRVGNIFSNCAGAGEVSDEAVSVVSDLYEQGYAGAVPSDTAMSVTVDGEKIELTEAQRQTMDRVWQKYVPDTMNTLVKSSRFAKLDAKTQEKVLKKLYQFALEAGKESALGNYAADDWVQEMKDSKDPAKWLIENTAIGGKYGAFISAGVPEETAYRATQALDNLKPAPGKKSVTELQKCSAVVDTTDSHDAQMKMLSEIMGESSFKKLQVATDYQVTPKTYVSVKQMLPDFDADGNGSYKSDEVRMCLNSIPHLKQEARAALWQMLTGSKSAKNNPYSVTVGKRVLAAAE